MAVGIRQGRVVRTEATNLQVEKVVQRAVVTNLEVEKINLVAARRVRVAKEIKEHVKRMPELERVAETEEIKLETNLVIAPVMAAEIETLTVEIPM